MKQNRYNELYKELNPSLKMKLNAIRMNLHEGKASCLVGAGFSKNAEMDDAIHMKDWFELADDFYETLYGEKPDDKNVRYKNVLRLASQVEASKGRGELESLIQNSLPDERVYPGRLHIELMKLPWSDVFTTNYDTLLEKAFIEADRYYYKVTNKETLLYTPHPRLIKLHGSFPDIRPFIITEEDYRTYPQRFPEFVNTVRQSLIENVLCLIGFSGDDPNFLSWIGWLRDVMGEQASPVYQITYNNQMHDSNIHLSHDLGIDVINLADIKKVSGFSEALDFFFMYIGKKYKTDWSGELKNAHTSIHIGENYDVDALIKEMKMIRESYPGWIVLPASHMSEFSDTKEYIPFWTNIYAKCANDVIKQVNFLFEVNWRIETALASPDMEWYLQALEQLPSEDANGLDNSTYQKLLGLKLSLLNTYRFKGADDDYVHLLENIETHISQLTYEHKRQLNYIKCLYAISTLNYSNVQQVVDDWNLRSFDYQGHLWKAGMLIEMGQLRESQVMLRDLLKSVKRNILTSKYSAQLSSVRSAIELFLWRMDYMYSMYKSNPDFDFAEIARTCRDMIVKEENKPSHHQITHGFNLLDTGQQWNFGGSGFRGDYYGAIRYFRLYEKLGFPFGMPVGFSSEVETKTFMIERLMRYYPKYALQWIVRCCETKTINALNRETLLHIRREDACAFFDKSIASCEIGLDRYAGRILQKRVLTCLLPILVKLSVLLTQERMERVFNALCIVYRQHSRKYDGKQVQTLYDNLSGESLKRCQKEALEQPILQSGVREEDFKMPNLLKDEIDYSIEAGNIAMTGLSSDVIKEQQAAYKRLRILKRTKKDDLTSSVLDTCINVWRTIPPLSDDKLESFYEFPAEENTMKSIAASELDSFLATDFTNENSSAFIDKISNKLFRLQIGFPRFTEEQHSLFLNKVIKILTENEDAFKKDDSDSFFGGFRSHVERIFSYLNYYSQVEGLPSKENDIWLSFKNVIERYRKHGYPVLTIMTHLVYWGIWNKTTIKSYVNKAIFSESSSLVRDAGQALIYTATKQGSKVNQTIIKDIISKVSYVFDESTHTYLRIIRDFLLNKGISKEAHVKLEEWVNNLPYRIERCSVSEEIKDDIRYYANQIAGIMTTIWPDWAGLSAWQTYMEKEHIKNDVRNGFEIGVRLANS